MLSLSLRMLIDGKPLRTVMRALVAGDDKIAGGMQKGMHAVLLEIERELVNKTYARVGLYKRSGDLARSYGSGPKGILEVNAKGRGRSVVLVGRIGSTLIYAPIQEHGATIRAKSGGWLHFPILRPGGGSGAGAILGWAKKKQVTIPARPALGMAMRNVQESGRAGEILGDWVLRSVDEVFA